MADNKYYRWKLVQPPQSTTPQLGTGESNMAAVDARNVPGTVLPAALGTVDSGARVGILRNLEFSAGGRAHRVSKGSYSTT